MRKAVTFTVFLVLAAGCGSGELSAGERERAERSLAAIREFCQTSGRAVFVHGGLPPAHDRMLHAERRGVEALIELYRDKPDAAYDPPGAANPTPMRVLLDRLSRELRFCDIESTDAIVRALGS